MSQQRCVFRKESMSPSVQSIKIILYKQLQYRYNTTQYQKQTISWTERNFNITTPNPSSVHATHPAIPVVGQTAARAYNLTLKRSSY